MAPPSFSEDEVRGGDAMMVDALMLCKKKVRQKSMYSQLMLYDFVVTEKSFFSQRKSD
jgi:hypothetical protein